MPTKCKTKKIVLSPVRRRKLLLEFNGGQITSDAGVLLLREVDQTLHLTERISARIPDPRNPFFITHSQRTLISQRVLAIACGWEDLNDQKRLRVDPAWQIATNRGVDEEVPLGSPSTLCRLENRVSRASCVRLWELLVEVFIASHEHPPEEVVLDFDATDDPVHGQQESRFFHGYYDEYCFLPLYVFCGSQVLCAYLRPSNIDGAKHSWAVLSLLVERLRAAWPQVRIIFRGDSGFCRWRMMRWCDRHGVGYIIGLPRNEVLAKRATSMMQDAASRYAATLSKQRLFGWTEYQASTWDRPRRVLLKAEHTAEGPNLRLVVTNLAEGAQQLYDQVYCARGQMENYIKDQQIGLFADRTSCHDFIANQFRVLLSAMAYTLVDHLRRTALMDTELATAQADTIRLKLFKIGAVVVSSVRRLVLHLSSAYPLRELFQRVCQRLREQRVAVGRLSVGQHGSG